MSGRGNDGVLENGAVRSADGFFGSALGVWLFALLRQLGQIDLVISLCYVVFLGIVGGLMFVESLGTLVRRRNRPGTFSKRHRHLWLLRGSQPRTRDQSQRCHPRAYRASGELRS